MKRLPLIDGLRGYFLVFMLVNHLNFTGDYWLVHLNFRELAFVEDAQGFVFLSGLLVGMIYAPRMLKHGFRLGAKAIHRRAGELYVHAVALVGLAVLAFAVIPAAPPAWGDWLGALRLSRPSSLISAALLLFQPSFMDILPQYVVYMLAAPPIVWACAKGRGAMIAAGSFILWLSAQLGVHLPLLAALNAWLVQHGQLGLRGSFNLLGWQIVFFSGAGLGVLTATGKARWGEVFSTRRTWAPKIALAICLIFLPFRIATAHGLMPQSWIDQFNLIANRTDFGLIYLINFAAVAVGLAWLLIAGPQSPHRGVRRVARALTGVLTAPFLRLLGRHSLAVYCWHIPLIYAIRYLDMSVGPFSEPFKVGLGLACIPLLAIPALWLERQRLTPPPSGAAARTRDHGAAVDPAFD